MGSSGPTHHAMGSHVPREGIGSTKTVTIIAEKSLSLWFASFPANLSMPIVNVLIALLAVAACPNVRFLVLDRGKSCLAFGARELVFIPIGIVGIGRVGLPEGFRDTLLQWITLLIKMLIP